MFSFHVSVRGQLGDFKRSKLSSVIRHAVLREADYRLVQNQYPPGRPGLTLVAFHDWTGRMFSPLAHELVREIKAQRIVLVWRRTCKHPPSIVILKDRRIREAPLNERSHTGPLGGGVSRFIHTDGLS